MDLTNADGSTAEMSGNGMRCLAQAAVQAGLVSPPTFTVATLGGVRTVEFRSGGTGHPDWASVDMGPARLGPERPPAFSERRARLVDVGNPHLVLLGDDPGGVDVAELGSKLQGEFPGGVNVEFIAVGPGPDALTLRGVRAGGRRDPGLRDGDRRRIGGRPRLGPGRDHGGRPQPRGAPCGSSSPPDTVVLSGPVAFVADVTVEPAALLAGRRP